MRGKRPAGNLWRRPLFARIDVSAQKINPLLVFLAILLALADLGGYSARELERWYPPQAASPPPAAQHTAR
jgi:hypothetical protein